MTFLKTTIASFILMLSITTVNAQNVVQTFGEKTKANLIKGGNALNFTANGDNYFFIRKYEQANMNYYLESYNSTGGSAIQTKLEINPGVFNNSFSIDDVISLGNNAYTLVEHLDKPSGKCSLHARMLHQSGKIAEDGVELMSYSFEKTMNSGFNDAAVSPDNNRLVVVGQLPFVKGQSAALKIAVYDKYLKKISESDVSIPGEDTKNKNIKVAVANDGTVYLIKETKTRSGEIALAVYQNNGSSELKEYALGMNDPYQFYTYVYTVNPSNELIISGTYYERKTISAGEKKAIGIFYFTNKEQQENLFKSFPLDSPVDNLTAQKVLVNGNTIFLTTEQYKEERIAPPAGTTGAAAVDYNYNYSHKNEYIIAMDTDGNKKFELTLGKDLKAQNFDLQLQSSFFISNNKLTIFYNDQADKYPNSGYRSLIPVIVQITNDGLMQSPIVFTEKLKLPNYSILYPIQAIQTSDKEFTLLIKDAGFSQYMHLKIE